MALGIKREESDYGYLSRIEGRNPMTNTREERVARAIVDATQGQLARLFGESSKLGGFDGYTEDGKAEALEVARAAIAALSVEPSPDAWEAIEGARLLADLLMNHDHKRLCQGREYVCSCGYDKTLYEAAKLLQGALPDPPEEDTK